MWHVYLLRCCDGSLYCGATNDVKRRLRAHCAGTASKYTRSRLPVHLVWTEQWPDKRSAYRREWQVKQMSKADKEALACRSTST